MKSIYVTFTDAEIKKLIKIKNGMSWHRAIEVWANAYRRSKGENIPEYGKKKGQ